MSIQLILISLLAVPRKYPATSEFLRLWIAIIAWISGYIYSDISPDTIHQPAVKVLSAACSNWWAVCLDASQLGRDLGNVGSDIPEILWHA